ncbi:hypothetical protein D3C71_1934060 [compost metagenome]
MQVHVGTIEQRVAFTEHGDRAPGGKMRRYRFGRRIVEVGDLGLVGAIVLVDFGRHRIV